MFCILLVINSTKEDDNYAKIGLEESEGDDSVFGDSSDENNCYAKVVRPPAPPVRIQSIRRSESFFCLKWDLKLLDHKNDLSPPLV